MMRRLTVPLLLLGLCALVGAVAQASPTVARLPVTGYQEESSAPALIGTDASALTSVGVDGTTLTPSGRAVQDTDPQARAQERAAHASGLTASLLVSNWSDRINDFSEPLAHRMLASASAIRRVTAQLAATVRLQGWNGITIDLESLTGRDAAGLTRFARALRTALGPGPGLDIDVMNGAGAGGFRAAGYDLRALSHSVDALVLMAYDQHGPWENTPGPVGALAWARAGIAAMTHEVPADRIVLGVAGYGYAWEPHANIQVSDARARAMAASAPAPAQFDARVGEWHVRLADGTVLWWSDGRSLALREALARRWGLGGVAIWDLQLSDPLTGAAP